jgi:hypothetical protein
MGTAPPTPSRTAKLQRLFDLAAAQAGYFTAAQARDLGYTPRSLVHRVTAGHFERVSRGFYRLHGVPGGHQGHATLLVELLPHHVPSGDQRNPQRVEEPGRHDFDQSCRRRARERDSVT